MNEIIEVFEIRMEIEEDSLNWASLFGKILKDL